MARTRTQARQADAVHQVVHAAQGVLAIEFHFENAFCVPPAEGADPAVGIGRTVAESLVKTSLFVARKP